MSQTSAKPAWSRNEKALIVVSTVVVALGVVFITAIRHQNELPPISIPNPKLPSPNAFDYFTRAGAAVVDSDQIGFAIMSHHSSPFTGNDHPYTQAEKEALVTENTSALNTLRRGFEYPYVNPPARSFSAVFPYFGKERGLARLLALESQARAVRGDWGGAVDSNLDAMQLGTMVPHGSVVIGSLVGIACEAIGRRPVWRNYQHLNAAQSRTAAQRLEHLATQEVSFADTMQEEEWTGQAGLLEILRAPDWHHEMASLMSSSGSYPNKILEVRLMLTPKRRILENYTVYMNQIVANGRKPYALAPPPPPIPNDPICQILLPVFNQARLRSVDNQTQNTLLMTTLALRAFRQEHGAYPAALTALSPSYLKAIPVDPFARTGPLRYRRTANGYVLYSVGPDAKDDGGTSILDTSKPAPTPPSVSDSRRYTEQDSKGDIVAGVNIY